MLLYFYIGSDVCHGILSKWLSLFTYLKEICTIELPTVSLKSTMLKISIRMIVAIRMLNCFIMNGILHTLRYTYFKHCKNIAYYSLYT